MRKRTPEEERRVVPRKTKIAIIAFFALCVALVVWYKIPYERTYTAELMRWDEGETDLYGTLADVEIRVKVQRYFFAMPAHIGTVTVNGDEYTNDIGTFVPAKSLLGAFASPETFEIVCSEFHGSYLLTRCIAFVENGQITGLYVRDRTGAYAGQYGPMPKNSQ